MLLIEGRSVCEEFFDACDDEGSYFFVVATPPKKARHVCGAYYCRCVKKYSDDIDGPMEITNSRTHWTMTLSYTQILR